MNRFYDFDFCRKDTFSLGVCNGCQLMALLGWIPWRGITDVDQPRYEFILNRIASKQEISKHWLSFRNKNFRKFKFRNEVMICFSSF